MNLIVVNVHLPADRRSDDVMARDMTEKRQKILNDLYQFLRQKKYTRHNIMFVGDFNDKTLSLDIKN